MFAGFKRVEVSQVFFVGLFVLALVASVYVYFLTWDF